MLWIAFIFQYLWDTKQLILPCVIMLSRCELLSFFSIFGIQNNSSFVRWISIKTWGLCFRVVNCFHFSVSLGYKTTRIFEILEDYKLWIAFIFQYLWDTKQLGSWKFPSQYRCELLSFFSIFGIQNNDASCGCIFTSVVNCFHFSVSLGYKTTLTPIEWMRT